MKKKMKMTAMFVVILLTMTLISCTSDDVLPEAPFLESEECHTVKANMNINKSEFDAGSTRAVSDGTGWKDGDIIYLLFDGSNGKSITGEAKYAASDYSWNLSYYGSLPRDIQARVKAYFFDVESESDISRSLDKVTFTGKAGVYIDLSGLYIFPIGGNINIEANLQPQTSRIRFKGEKGNTFQVGGIKCYTSLIRASGEMTQSTNLTSVTVQDNGYTPYVYGEFSSKNAPYIYVKYPATRYIAECTSSIFQKGKSGWMNAPTYNKHNGWITFDGSFNPSLDRVMACVEKGNTVSLIASFSDDVYDKTVTWSSSDNSIATIDNTGKITGVSVGKATITATSNMDNVGYATCSLIVEPFHDYEDLGLTSGTLWATCNVGATSPEDCGFKFAWGEINSKYSFTSSNYTYTSNSLPWEKDAAFENWPMRLYHIWRMPTRTEMEELISECTYTFTTLNGMFGCKMTSKKNGKSIFLPGNGSGSTGSGAYWTKTYYDDSHAYQLGFYSSTTSGIYCNETGQRFEGKFVRPVYDY